MRERQRRKAAEAEVFRLQGLLESNTIPVAAQAPPTTAQTFAQVVGQLKQVERQLEDEQDLVRQVIDASPNLVYVDFSPQIPPNLILKLSIFFPYFLILLFILNLLY